MLSHVDMIYLAKQAKRDVEKKLSAPACTACTDMVYSKELELDVTTTAMAKALVRLKTKWHLFLHRT